MKIFKSEQVSEIDAYTIKHEPVKSIDLMERAAKAFVSWFTRNIDNPGTVFIFSGPGNNGGDGMAIARMLHDRNYRVRAYLLHFTNKLSGDCAENVNRLKHSGEELYFELDEESVLPVPGKNDVIIDAIFGSGLSRPVEGFPARVIQHINQSEALTVSVDIPSGLFGEDNRDNIPENIVRARYTVTFEFPFLSFFFADNVGYTGEWTTVSIGLHPRAIEEKPTPYTALEMSDIKNLIKDRPKYSHKGTYGHGLIIAGSYGMLGASILTTHACLRSGAGLVTAHVPRLGYSIIQTALPEALVSIDQSDFHFTEVPDLSKYTAIGIGPGLAKRSNTQKAFCELLKTVKVPLVIDADGLNILSDNPDWMDRLPENSILTPHPGEFDRLAGESRNFYERHLKQLQLAKRYKSVIILKGANTIVAAPDGRSWINTTGNPGMATGGSGDVLTGILVSLLAQGYKPVHAAITAIFIHGLAGDLVLESESMESLISGDIVMHIGKAFKAVKSYKMPPPPSFF